MSFGIVGRYLVTIGLVATFAHGQIPINCQFAPDAFQPFCVQLFHLDALSRNRFAFNNRVRPVSFRAPSVPGMSSVRPAVPRGNFAPTAFDCMSLQCICPYMHGRLHGSTCILQSGLQLQKAFRREYRMLSDYERNRYHSAVQQLKRNGDYDRFSRIHQQAANSAGAHSGPAFLPWHREYTKRIEIALRMIDSSLAIPYWDSILDSYLPVPRDSILWSPLFAGETDAFGNVVNGPYAAFSTLDGKAAVSRRLGAEGRLFTEADLRNLLNQRDIVNVLAFTAPRTGCPFRPNYGALEYAHGSVHIWVGGDMKPVVRSSNDPIFYPHHSFVDFIWEQYRQLVQNRWEREQAYPPEIQSCTNPMHFRNAPMLPFNMRNLQGLSNAYTDNLYTYAPRPTCSTRHPTCDSPYLFCDFLNGPPHCVSKVKPNGVCRGFGNQMVCYRGECINGYCRQTGIQPQRRYPRRIEQPDLINEASANNSSETQTTHKSIMPETCFNDDPCCPIWAQQNNCSTDQYMLRFCRRSCGVCSSRLNQTNGCTDRHVSCAQFRAQGECTNRRQWMSENCAKSCAWCNLSPLHLCQHVAQLSQ